jgi:hypothetical protein
VLILQPGNAWVVERSPPEDEETEAALRTCHLRGWVEPVVDAIPKGQLTPAGELPQGGVFSGHGPLYRLTDAGWSAINRSHRWVIVSWLVALASLVASIVGILVARWAAA